jgi:acyl-CoA synthetase (AMP-forming)/AMP-acid ligase II
LYYLGESSAAAVRAHLAWLLPAAELPDAVVPIDQFPLTARGKVDRGALRNLLGYPVAASL